MIKKRILHICVYLGVLSFLSGGSVFAQENDFYEIFEVSMRKGILDEKKNLLLFEGINPYTEEEREQLAYDKKMSYWKEKQALYWEQLPKEDFLINASAYTAAADECGKSDGITASGIQVQEQRTLACPPQYPFGVQIYIEGMGLYTCEDRGGAIKDNKFDIYMETKTEAFQFGRRELLAYVVD